MDTSTINAPYSLADSSAGGPGPGPGIQGPVGPIGPTGPQGAQGPQGLEGPEGPQGPIGQTGQDGQDGAQGIEGPQGPAGEIGTLIGYFENREPSFPGTMPPDGLLPADWDNPTVPPNPPAPYQMTQGQGLLNSNPTSPTLGHIWVYVTTAETPTGWVDAGMIQGPPGPQGIQGVPGVDGVDGIDGTTVIVSDQAPTVNVQEGDLWWDSVGGNLFIWYEDANSSQWVVTVNQPIPPPVAGGNFLPLVGGQLTGPLTTTSTIDLTGPTQLQMLGGAAGDILSTDGAGDLSWIVPPISFPEAPLDGMSYARSNAGWIAGGVFNRPVFIQGSNSLALIGPTAAQNSILSGRGTPTIPLWRWQLILGDQAAEGPVGSNAGSNFALNSFTDTGGALATPLSINRATSAATFSGVLNAPSATLTGVLNAGSALLTGALNAASATLTGPFIGITGLFSGGVTVNGGAINIGSATASTALVMQKAAGANGNQLIGFTGANVRWNVQLGDSTAESGANAGSNFSISRYGDAGAYLDSPLSINRANSNINFMASGIGQFIVGARSSVINSGIGFSFAGAGGNGFVVDTGALAINTISTSRTALGAAMLFYVNGAGVGSISHPNATTTAFNTTSDARLKMNPTEFDGGPIIDATNTYYYQWTVDPTVYSYGVMGQEAIEVFPQAVFYNDQEDTWGIDYSKYVPILLNEVKTLRQRVAALEAAR